MSDMSPLQRLLLKVLRAADLVAAFLLVLFIAITFWKQANPLDLSSLSPQDWKIVALLSVMLLCDLWLYRAIDRELKKPGA